jgi:hypothetical protein
VCGTSVLLVAGPPCTMDWRTCVQLLVDGRYASMCSRRRRTWLDMVVPPHLQAVMFDAASMSGRTTPPRASSCDVCGGSSWPCAVFKGTGSTLAKVFDPADHLGLTSSPPSGAQVFLHYLDTLGSRWCTLWHVRQLDTRGLQPCCARSRLRCAWCTVQTTLSSSSWHVQ